MVAHIDTWIFDLDNTLYPASASLFPQIDRKMGRYIQQLLGVGADEARAVQKGFFHSHGMTLPGLMEVHGVDPHHFLDYVHDVDVDVVQPRPDLSEMIGRLPGKKLVFTNADAPYAARVLERLGLAGRFDGLCDIHALGYVPKPQPGAYSHLCAAHGVDPARAVFVEDMARNLVPAKAMGMTTVWVDNGSEQGPGDALAHIDYRVGDVGQFLTTTLKLLEDI
jgi:putative hydrolase of the HAD superfamily